VTAEVVRSAHLFSNLPDDLIEDLRAIAVPLERSSKAVLFLEGDPSPGLYVALSGHIKISRIARTGREQVVTVIGPGQYFNLVPVFDGGACPANAESLDESRLLLFPTDALHHIVQRNPALGLVLLKDLTSFMRKLVNLVDDLSLHSVQGRLARLLLKMADDAATGAPRAPLTQADMAAQLGTVREMVGRSLKSFETLGLIKLDRGLIQVVNRDGLVAQAED
jgi:CRP/FNR family transcriptional regulator, cyclic AMP receptor protein